VTATHALAGRGRRRERLAGACGRLSRVDGEEDGKQYGDEDRTQAGPLVRAQPLIAVRDVAASSRWYGHLLGLDSLAPAGGAGVYDRLLSGGELVLQLRVWDEGQRQGQRPNLVGAAAAPHGHGVLLWFQLDDFDAAVERAQSLRADVIAETPPSPVIRHREMWIRDPDGYVVVIASSDGATT
jgi:catechol 2,3-dioxygenase-like lactoylglutathione lyase family enzyme